MFIPYKHPITGKYHRYYPDFKIWSKTKDGKEEVSIIEVKPFNQTQEPKVQTRKTRKYINEVNLLKNITKDMKKNDEVILHIDRNEFTYYKNDKVVAKITNAKLTNIIFLPWLGDNAITKACRKDLLGN